MRKLRLKCCFAVMMINIYMYVIALSKVYKLIRKFEDLISTECMNAASVQISICCIHVLTENTYSPFKRLLVVISPLKFEVFTCT